MGRRRYRWDNDDLADELLGVAPKRGRPRKSIDETPHDVYAAQTLKQKAARHEIPASHILHLLQVDEYGRVEHTPGVRRRHRRPIPRIQPADPQAEQQAPSHEEQPRIREVRRVPAGWQMPTHREVNVPRTQDEFDLEDEYQGDY